MGVSVMKSKRWFDVVCNTADFASRCVVEGDDKNKYLSFSFKPKCQNLKTLDHIGPLVPQVSEQRPRRSRSPPGFFDWGEEGGEGHCFRHSRRQVSVRQVPQDHE